MHLRSINNEEPCKPYRIVDSIPSYGFVILISSKKKSKKLSEKQNIPEIRDCT